MFDPADTWTRVTASTHPQVHAAFDLISGKHHSAYNVPYEYAYGLDSTENLLGQLDVADRERLCHGETDVLVISFATVAALDIFAAFVHDWPARFMKRRRIGGHL